MVLFSGCVMLEEENRKFLANGKNVTIVDSGCIEDTGTFTRNVKTMTPITGALSGELRYYVVTFDEGNLLTQDSKYQVESQELIEKLYKAYIQHKKVVVKYKYILFADYPVIISVTIVDD